MKNKAISFDLSSEDAGRIANSKSTGVELDEAALAEANGGASRQRVLQRFVACNAAFVACNAAFTRAQSSFVACNAAFSKVQSSFVACNAAFGAISALPTRLRTV